MASNYSIGIIGGADGPTAVLVSGNPVIPLAITGVVIIAVIVGVVILVKRKKK